MLILHVPPHFWEEFPLQGVLQELSGNRSYILFGPCSEMLRLSPQKHCELMFDDNDGSTVTMLEYFSEVNLTYINLQTAYEYWVPL